MSDALSESIALDHPTLAIAVARRLRQLIDSGALAPGVRLNERDLCDRMKVSRTPLREAYRILSAEGLIELLPKRGARVVLLSAADVGNVFDLLAVVEGLAGRLAAERGSSQALQEIATLHRQMLQAFAERDMVRFSIVSKGTHTAINAAANNPVLTESHLRLNAQVQNLRYRSNFEGDNWQRSADEHEAFVQALLARQATRVEQLMRDHVLGKKDYALAELARQAAEAA